MRLEVEGLGVWRPHSGTAVDGLHLSVGAGETVLLVGPNGAGASSVLTAIAGRSQPGERRTGRIRWGTAEITFAHPDDIAGLMALVGPDGPPRDRTVAQVVAAGLPRRSTTPPRVDAALARLGLDDRRATPIRHLTAGERTRVQLAAALARRPAVLLLDQVLGAQEPRWKQAIVALVREHCAQGTAVLWADQDLGHALLGADRVVELDDRVGHSEPAWTWRPRTRPWTPLQQLATVLGPPDPDDGEAPLERLARLAPVLAGTVEHTAVAAPDRGSVLPVPLGAGVELPVDELDPPVFLCATTHDARRCRDQLAAANHVPGLPGDPHTTIGRLASRLDRRRGLPPGQALAELRQALPGVRPRSWAAWSSSGERAILRHVASLAGPAPAVLYEPFRHLDPAHVEALTARVRVAWRSGRPVLVVTTDVEAVARFGRVVVWSDGAIRADGRAEAILDHLPAVPLLAQLCAPHPVIGVEPLLAAAGTRSA